MKILSSTADMMRRVGHHGMVLLLDEVQSLNQQYDIRRRRKSYDHPEMALLLRSRLVIALPDDRMLICPLLHIASVETLQSA